MTLQELANLVIVRNHIYTLVNSSFLVPKNKKNSIQKLASSLDKLFLQDIEEVINHLTSNEDSEIKVTVKPIKDESSPARKIRKKKGSTTEQ